jgi:hypothetical protein
MPTRYQIMALWLMVLIGSAAIEGPRAYQDPNLRAVYIGFGLLTIAIILTWIGLRKLMKK